MIDLRQGDCLELLKDIPDGSVDMVMTDMPYGTTQCKWDTVVDLDALWVEVKRITKPNAAIVMTAQTPFDKVLGCSNLPMLRYELIWEKPRATGHLNAKKMPLKAHENILVFYKSLPDYSPQMKKGKRYSVGGGSSKMDVYGSFGGKRDNNGEFRYPRSLLKVSTETGLHPTQKPVALMEYLIKTYTNEQDVVIDMFMGSGSTGVAALNTNRKFIGIELDPEYFKIAEERINQAAEKGGFLIPTI